MNLKIDKIKRIQRDCVSTLWKRETTKRIGLLRNGTDHLCVESQEMGKVMDMMDQLQKWVEKWQLEF